MPIKSRETVMVTGATGYIGGRLIPRLAEEGYAVRALVRDSSRLTGRDWMAEVKVFEGDVLKADTLPPALAGVDVAYYLIHSMSGSREFDRRDISAARNFGRAARAAGVRRIIYLGGLGNPGSALSKHLRSRQETGEVLRASGVPVTEFRAAVIVGSGSLSFEMVRYLTERVPVMICPRWVYTRIQPIAIRDVLSYLLQALATPESENKVIEIGGCDILTYGEMMLGYARVRGLKRLLIPVPLLTPYLSSYWVHWVTPIPTSLARPLIEGLRNEVVVRSQEAARIFPRIHPIGYQEAVQRALAKLEAGRVETTWSDAIFSTKGDRPPVTLSTHEGMILERREKVVEASREAVFENFSSLGGKRGWLYFNWAWEIRGWLDRLLGGVGMRRGRRAPQNLRVGDALDFWRVEEIAAGRLLRLRAEMRVPGKAWLQFEALSAGDQRTRLVQTAFFAPRGLGGLLYWYLLYPIHGLIFSGLIERLAATSVRAE